MQPDATTVTDAVRVIDLVGVLGNAVLGGIAARAARLDLVGFAMLAVLSGLGGGMIRDALLQQGTVAALVDPAYLLLAVSGAAVAFFIPFRRRFSRRALTLVDALALGCWANVGAQKTLDAGLDWLPALMLGVITAVGGGMVRDVMLRQVPIVFGGNTLYATSALVAAAVTVVAAELGHPSVGAVLAILTAASLALLARRYDWRLPTDPPQPRRRRQAPRPPEAPAV